jgi:hypothetical protein
MPDIQKLERCSYTERSDDNEFYAGLSLDDASWPILLSGKGCWLRDLVKTTLLLKRGKQ